MPYWLKLGLPSLACGVCLLEWLRRCIQQPVKPQCGFHCLAWSHPRGLLCIGFFHLVASLGAVCACEQPGVTATCGVVPVALTSGLGPFLSGVKRSVFEFANAAPVCAHVSFVCVKLASRHSE